MKSCLVVDDSRVVRKVVRRIIEDLHFQCTEAENGKEAFDLCLKSMPDAILIDWNMPIMSGIEFVEKLRDTDGGDHPKVLFCTTESNVEYIKRALKSGADEYVMKPFDSEIIQSKFILSGLIEKT